MTAIESIDRVRAAAGDEQRTPSVRMMAACVIEAIDAMPESRFLAEDMRVRMAVAAADVTA